MSFISEKTIDQVVAKLEAQPKQYEALVRQLSQEQPAIVAYLFSDTFNILLQKEREFLLYLGLVIWLSIKEITVKLEQVTPELLGEFEEQNYAMLEGASSRNFRERLDVFFQNYPQEDLLSFVEDALNDEEELEVTKTGREPMFIALKTIIDSLV